MGSRTQPSLRKFTPSSSKSSTNTENSSSPAFILDYINPEARTPATMHSIRKHLQMRLGSLEHVRAKPRQYYADWISQQGQQVADSAASMDTNGQSQYCFGRNIDNGFCWLDPDNEIHGPHNSLPSYSSVASTTSPFFSPCTHSNQQQQHGYSDYDLPHPLPTPPLHAYPSRSSHTPSLLFDPQFHSSMHDPQLEALISRDRSSANPYPQTMDDISAYIFNNTFGS